MVNMSAAEAATADVLLKKLLLKISQYSQNACVGVSFLSNFIKKRFHHRCFPVNIAKFLRISISKNICQRLFLQRQRSAVSLFNSLITLNILFYY